MSIAVHITGRSDVGVDIPARAEVDRANALVNRRIESLAAMDGHRAAGVLADYAWDGVDEEGSPARTAPLTRHLAGLAPEAEVSTLLLLGTTAGNPGATLPIAEAVAAAVTADPGAFGRHVHTVRVVDVGDLGERTSFPRILAAVEGLFGVPGDDPAARNGGAVSLTWGSGPTSIALSAFAALLEVRARVRLIDPDTGTELDYTPEPGQLDPRIPWYLQLGYPGLVLAQRVPCTPTQKELLRRIDGRQKLVDQRTPPDVRLAEYIAASLRRREVTAGLALRAGVIRRYQQLRQADEVDLLDPQGGGEAEDLLGHALGRAQRIPVRRRTIAQRFLLGARPLNDAGSGAAHRLQALTVPRRAAAADLVTALTGDDDLKDQLTEHGLAVVPRTPSTVVLAIWVVGTNTERALGPELLRRGPDDAVLTALEVPRTQRDALSLSALLLATEETSRLAEDQTAAINAAGDEELGTSLAVASAQVVGPLDRTDPVGARKRMLEVLMGLPEPPAAILLAPTGDKNIVLGALLALLDWAGQHGVPIFVRDMTSGSEGVSATHQLPGYLGADVALADAALHCLRFLDIGAAARVLGAGSRRLSDIGARCVALQAAFVGRAEWTWPAVVREETNEALISARLELCHHALATHVEAWEGSLAERFKLVHLAASLVEVSLGRDRFEDLKRERVGRIALDPSLPPPAMRVRNIHEALRVLKVLREARNHLPISHGVLEDGTAVNRVIAAACAEENLAAANLTRLLACASQAVTRRVLRIWPVRDAPDTRLAELYDDLVRDLEAFAG